MHLFRIRLQIQLDERQMIKTTFNHVNTNHIVQSTTATARVKGITISVYYIVDEKCQNSKLAKIAKNEVR